MQDINTSKTKENSSISKNSCVGRHIVDEFTPKGGHHCISNSLRQIFDHNHHSVSEEMIFGLASGLSFIYLNINSVPFISGRSKVFSFEKVLAERLNISIICRESRDFELANKKIKSRILDNQPILVYADMFYMDYLHMSDHFGGHSIIIFGYDDNREMFWVSDRDNSDFPIHSPRGKLHSDYHLVSYEEMEKARCSKMKPYPARNKFLEINFTGMREIDDQMLYESIDEVCKNMLTDKPKMLGVNGIYKFAGEIKKWNKFDKDIYTRAVFSNYFQINAAGGTGGGIFRKLYGQFLMESSSILDNPIIRDCGEKMVAVSKKWDMFAEVLLTSGKTKNFNLLPTLSEKLEEIAEIERMIYQTLAKESAGWLKTVNTDKAIEQR